MDFPLYTSLMNSELPKQIFTDKLDKKLIKKIKRNRDSHEYVYALIKCYFIEHGGDALVPPFEASLETNQQIEFDIDLFPDQLKNLLLKFLKIHEKKNREDKEFQSFASKEEEPTK